MAPVEHLLSADLSILLLDVGQRVRGMHRQCEREAFSALGEDLRELRKLLRPSRTFENFHNQALL